MALVVMVNEISQALDSGEHVVDILDFSRFKIQDSRLFIVIHLSPGIYIQSTL